MFKIAYSSLEYLNNCNKVTVDYAERPRGIQYDDFIRGKGSDHKPTKAEILTKYVHNGEGGYEDIMDAIKSMLSKTSLNITPDEVYEKLIDELHRVGDYDDDLGPTNNVYKYITKTVLVNLIKTIMTVGSHLYDPIYYRDDYVTESNQDIDAGVLSTEALLVKQGRLDLAMFEGNTIYAEEDKKNARRDLVSYLDQLYQFQISSSSNKNEDEVSSQLKYAQSSAAHALIQMEVEVVESSISGKDKRSLPTGAKPDLRKRKRHASAINKDGNADKYHARLSLSSMAEDFASDPQDRVYTTAIMGIARCSEILEIPFVLLDSEKIMRAAYIRELYSCLNGQQTLCITEYDLLEYDQKFTYSDAYLEAIRKEVKALKVNNSSLPESKMHLVITPEVQRTIRGVKLNELRDFNKFVQATAVRGVNVWKEKPANRGDSKAKTSVEMSIEYQQRVKNDARMATYGVSVSTEGAGKFKKGPAHPDTLIYIAEKVQEHRIELIRKGNLNEFQFAKNFLIEHIYNIDITQKLIWRNTYLYNQTKDEFVTVNVKDYVFNKAASDEKDLDGYCDFLIKEDGYLVSNYISAYSPPFADTKYIYSLKSEYSGLIILTPNKQLVYKEL